jgi:hypothetical protein
MHGVKHSGTHLDTALDSLAPPNNQAGEAPPAPHPTNETTPKATRGFFIFDEPPDSK